MKRVFPILLTILVAVSLSNGAENVSGKKIPSLKKALATSDLWIDVNRMDAIFRNNGTWMYDNIAGGEGLFWPKGTHLSPIFGAGQWLGAVVDGEVRIAGIQHSASEYQAGEIISPGVAANPKDGKYKWYTLYPGGVGDWTSWPVDQGAPVDANGDPLLIGDVTAFSVWNDLAEHAWVGTNKLNAEVRQTVFAFNRADALGDMIFIKWQIINKGASDWDSTYFSIWVDPDLGDAGDDLVGCDTTLGLGFCYNAGNNDQRYGAAPPATGIDFFQGPIIDEVGSTVSLPDGTVLPDKTMLKMTSFVYYDNEDSPKGNPDTGGDVWNYFRGIWRDNKPITYGLRGREDPSVDHPVTNFMFPGDPETEQAVGWLDYEEEDRRFLMTTGPFNMPAWVDDNGNGAPDFGETGVQEIVAVVIVARGDNNLNSVTKLKQVDELAQMAYDLNFKLASAPTPPAVAVSELPNQVVLTWEERSELDVTGIAPYSSTDPIVAQAVGDTVIMDNVEKVIDDSTYNFYGYTVYQYADAAGGDPVVLEHWDNGGEAAAVPYVSQRFVRILVNKNSRVGDVGAPLINGKPYYFGVVAEGYLEYGAPKILPSAATIVTAVPQYTPGVRYEAAYKDSIPDSLIVYHQVDESLPSSQGSVTVWVVDPSKTNADDYKVIFNEDKTWNLINTSKVDTVLKNQTNQRGDDAYNVVDGLMVVVSGPMTGVNKVYETDASDNVVDASVSIMGPSLGTTGYLVSNRAGAYNVSDARDWDRFELFGVDDYEFDFGDSSLTWDYLGDNVHSKKAPFALYRHVLTTGVKERMYIAIWDTDESDGWSLDPDNWVGPVYGAPSYEPVYAYVSAAGPYDPAQEAAYIAANDITAPPTETGFGVDTNPTLYPIITATLFTMYLEDATLPIGNKVWFVTNKPNTPNDYFTFTAPAAKTVADTLLVVDIDKINVVPNPYYGYHSGELNIFDRWVQFTYLPPKATIRIYDLAGQLIRKLEKDDPTTTFLQWDLGNAYDLPVASGVYIYVVDTDYGQKIGKMAVFAPNERVDIW